ncbi:MAG: sodium-independent anion transporter, partial [Proteobacteria bacterium]|nr:sodium-independent anion transporter [Pseudomonadota bacterium]
KLFEPSVVLVDGESISDIDATAIATFSDLHAELQRLDIDLRFASMKSHVMEIIERANAVENIGPERFYVSIQAGVDDYLAD